MFYFCLAITNTMDSVTITNLPISVNLQELEFRNHEKLQNNTLCILLHAYDARYAKSRGQVYNVILRMSNLTFEYHEEEISSNNAKSKKQNNNKPDHLVHNNSQSDNFARINSQYDNFACSNSQYDDFTRGNSQYDNFTHINNQSDFFTRSNERFDNFTCSNDRFDNFIHSNNQFDNFMCNTTTFPKDETSGTETGKFTIINMVTNYFLSRSLDEPKIVISSKYYKVTEKEFVNEHSEVKLDDITKSQIKKYYNYNFKHPNNSAYKFIFIDTPELSDMKEISAGSLSATMIIANGTEARVTPSIKNTLVRLANNLPDAIINNLFIFFYMNNQAFCTDPQIWKNNFEECITVQYHWDKSIKKIDILLKAITEMFTTSTQTFVKMKEYRDKIKSEIMKVTQDIINIQKVQNSLDAVQKTLQISRNNKNSFANYAKSKSIKFKKIVPVNHYKSVEYVDVNQIHNTVDLLKSPPI
ncbi:5685_t:CDS:10 [Diversispora eburnea]|uniref:5685_t:CDS:1 n=1 Tax=Diversispora eburnea TaxID=1213867 RepID=A0A9N8YJG3_9GLOM|nr:5685_t:CDS:10 [Diversispora eburnea]